MGWLAWPTRAERRGAKLKVYLSNSLSRSACRGAVLCVFTKCQNPDELLKKREQGSGINDLSASDINMPGSLNAILTGHYGWLLKTRESRGTVY